MTDNEYLAAIESIISTYNRTIKKIIRGVGYNIDLHNPRTAAIIREANVELNRLKAVTKKWALKYVPALYKDIQKDTEEWLKKATGKTELLKSAGFSVVNKQAIEALLIKPEIGFLSASYRAINSVKDGLNRIHTQAKLFKAHKKMIHQTLASTGILEGQNINTVVSELTGELISTKNISELHYVKNIDSLPDGHLLREMSDMPYVKIPTVASATGYRRLRLDRYVELLTRTKMRQAVTVARRNKLLEVGYELVQVNRRDSTVNDACNLYKGKIFALTEEAAALHNVPMVVSLPNGGIPFHPSCKHFEIPFIEGMLSDAEQAKAMKPPPKWALNKPFSAVNKIYKKQGGG